MSPSTILPGLVLVLLAGLSQAQSSSSPLAAYVDRLAEEAGFSGCVLLARDWKPVQAHCVGTQTDGRPLDLESRFQLASISKHFTAVAALRLVERGALTLDAPITTQLPELTGFDGTTLRHLLNNTGGVPNHDRFQRFAAARDAPIADSELLAMINGAGPRFPAGTRYEYSNIGWRLVALMIERASGAPYADFLQEELFAPSGLTATLALSEDDYRAYTGFDPLGERSWTPVITAHPDWHEGAGTIVSSPLDVLRWSELLSRGHLLSEERYGEFTSPVLDDYAMGLWVSPGEQDTALGHDGRFTGFAGDLRYRRSGSGFSLVLSNQQSRLPEALRGDLAALLRGEAPGDPARHLTTLKASPQSPEGPSLQGVYPLGPDFFLRVSKFGERLFIAGLWGDYAEMLPVGDLRYHVRVLDADVAFTFDEAGWPGLSWEGSPPFPRQRLDHRE